MDRFLIDFFRILYIFNSLLLDIIITIIKIIIISIIIIIKIPLATMASLKHKEQPHSFICRTERFILWNN